MREIRIRKAPPENEMLFKGQNRAADGLLASDSVEHYQSATSPLQPKISANKAIPGRRDYKTLYRAAWEYQMRHTPPIIDAGYWRKHTPGKDEPPEVEAAYMDGTAEDLSKTAKAFDNDPFLNDLLIAAYKEICAAYNQAREEAHNNGNQEHTAHTR